jgi:ATP-dependent DNA helicase RecQ
VYQLTKRDVKAVAIYSGMSYREINYTLDNCIHGDIKFLYVSPERLKTELFRERLKQMQVSLLAVDEAHCISQWGYDFRPEYLQIAEVRDILKGVPILALTASATPRVVNDIQEKLLFKKKNVFIKSFERSNISYSVSRTEDKYNKLVHILSKVHGLKKLRRYCRITIFNLITTMQDFLIQKERRNRMLGLVIIPESWCVPMHSEWELTSLM